MTTTATDKTTTTQVYRVYIRTQPQAIWDAITTPEWAGKYGYGGSVEFDLKPGGSYKAFASEEMKKKGTPDIVVIGEVIEADPPRKLVQTWHPIWDPASAAEQPTTLTYEIVEQQPGMCRLTLTHDLAGAPLTAAMVGGQHDDMGAGGGWAWVLSDLKTLLETGKSILG